MIGCFSQLIINRFQVRNRSDLIGCQDSELGARILIHTCLTDFVAMLKPMLLRVIISILGTQ